MKVTQYITVDMGLGKRIALVAHDNMKQEMIDWATEHRQELSQHTLCGTGTTAGLVSRATGLTVTGYRSGPLGGDIQLGSRITEGEIDLMVFFWDPLTQQPHDPDVKALLRIAALYNIPVATNRATADFLLSSPLMHETYPRRLMDFSQHMQARIGD